MAGWGAVKAKYKKVGNKWVIKKQEEIVMDDYQNHLEPLSENEDNELIEEKSEREKAKEAQEARAKKYGIGIKEGGHVTKPSQYKDVAEDDFLDACVTGDTLIYTNPEGPVPIAEIKEDNFVYSFEGGFQPFLSIGEERWGGKRKYEKQRFVGQLKKRKVLGWKEVGVFPIYEISTGHDKIKGTAEHPILTLKRDKPLGRRLEWTRLDHICKGDLLLIVKKLPNENNNGHSLAEMRSLGFYYGDGYLEYNKYGAHSLRLACSGKEEAEKYKAILGEAYPDYAERIKIYPHHQPPNKCYEVRLHSVDIARKLVKLCCAGNQHNRRIPKWIFQLSEDAISEFLKGYIDADGHTPQNGQHYIVSCNKQLLEDVKVLAKYAGWWSSNIYERKPTKNFGTESFAYQIVLYSNYRPQGKVFGGRDIFLENEQIFTVSRVRDIKQLSPEPVYDIMVEGSHNFVANGFIAHNTNFRYPADKTHLKAALAYFNHTENKTKGGYTDEEWAKMGKRLASKLGDEYMYDPDTKQVVKKKKQKKEEIEGGLDEYRNKVNQAVKAHFGKEYDVIDIVKEYVILNKWNEEEMNSIYFRASFKETDTGFEFGPLEQVEIKQVVKKKTEEQKQLDPEKFLIEEKIETSDKVESGHVFSLSGKILLEENQDKDNGLVVKAKVPMIKFNTFTENGNRYLDECWTWLEEDLKRLKESKSSRKVLDMFPTHRPALDPKHPDYFRQRAGKITGVSSSDGIGYIHFETLKTSAGQDMAVLLLEEMVDGVSLRAFPKNGYYEANNMGGDDVRRLTLLGADFTDVGSMPFSDEEKGFHLEEKKEDNIMEEKEKKELEELKAQKAKLEAEQKALEEEKKKLEEAQKQAAYEARKKMLIEHVTEKVNELEGLGDLVKANILSESKEAVDVIMAENENDEVAKLKIEEFIKGKAESRKKEIAESLQESMKAQKEFVTNPNVISTLKTEERAKGILQEETGGSHKVRDIILSRIFKRPVYDNGRFLLEEWDERLRPLLKLQKLYMQFTGRTGGDLLSPGGQLYETLITEEVQKNFRPLLEANEATTSTVIGSNLPTEVAAAIIYGAWPQTIAMNIAVTGDMLSTTKDIFEIGYPTGDNVFRRGQHEFGWVDEANPATLVTTTANPTTYGDFVDEGALSPSSNEYPQPLFARLIEVPAGTDMVITITGKDENGDTATWTVTFYTTDAAGTIKRCTPTNVGQKCTDVTGVSVADSSTLTAGQVGFFVEKPITGATAGSAEDKSYLGIVKSQATAQDYDLGARVDISTIEDMQLAMRDKGSGLDYLTLLVQTIIKSIVDTIDKKILYEIVDDATGGDQTFVQSTPDEGYTQAEWNKKFLYYSDLVVDETALAGNFEPDWMVWSRADRSRFMEWLGEGWTKYNVNRNELHLSSRSVGNVSGCEVFVSPNARRSRVAVGTRSTGIHYYVYVPFVILGPQWVPDTKTKAIMVHHRAALKITQPLTLGKLSIS